jgi:hypothetical protein
MKMFDFLKKDCHERMGNALNNLGIKNGGGSVRAKNNHYNN